MLSKTMVPSLLNPQSSRGDINVTITNKGKSKHMIHILKNMTGSNERISRELTWRRKG